MQSLVALRRMGFAGMALGVCGIVAFLHGQAHGQERPYRAVIVAVDRYEHLGEKDQLKFAVKSGLVLGQRLKNLGYRVAFFTDSVNFARLSGADRMAAEGLELAEAVPEQIVAWLEKHAPDSQLTLVVLEGHGVCRNNDPVLLTQRDTKTRGGLSVTSLERAALEKKWPVAIVFDACMSKVDSVAVASEDAKARRGTILRRPKSQEEHDRDRQNESATVRYPPRLMSTLPGGVASDERDLVTILAAGLEVQEGSGRFRADPWQGPASPGTGLSLFSWFHFTTTEQQRQHRFDQQAWVSISDARSLDTLVAQANPAGIPRAGKVRQVPQIDLLSAWRPAHGEYGWRTHDEGGYQITRPNMPAEEWIGGFLDLPPAKDVVNRFPSTGKSVLLEVVGEFDDNRKGDVSFGIDVKEDHQFGRFSRLTRDERNARFKIESGKPTWCRIDLVDGKALNYFAITDLAPRGVLHVRRLIFANTKDLPATGQLLTVEVLPRWWFGETTAGQAAPAFGFKDRERTRALWLDKGAGWRGGIVNPSETLVDGDEVEFDLEVEKAGAVFLDLKEDHTPLQSAKFKVEPGRKKYPTTMSRSGTFNYLAVRNPDTAVDILAITIKPRSSHVLVHKAP